MSSHFVDQPVYLLFDIITAVLIISTNVCFMIYLLIGYKPKAYIRAWSYVGVDPFEELLLGPTFATQQVIIP